MKLQHKAWRGPVRLSNRLTIRQGMIGAIVFILIIFGIASLIGIRTFENVSASSARANRLTTALVHTAELQDALTRQESALRGYALSGKPRYLGTLTQMRDQVSRSLDVLDLNGIGGSEQQARLSKIENLQTRWTESVAKPLIEQVRATDSAGARARLAAGVSISISDPIQVALTMLRSDLQNRLERSNAQLSHQQQSARRMLLGMLVLGLLAGLVTVRAVLGRLTGPLTELIENTRRLAAGERDVVVRFRHREDEIGALAAGLRQFRRLMLDQDHDAWIRDNNARVTVLLNQCSDEVALGDTLLAELAPLLGAGYAALFLPVSLDDDESRYGLTSAYGYPGDRALAFDRGEGLVGQVMVSGESIELDRVPSHYLPVRSGLGEASPSVLLVAPAMVRRQVVGVIEIAMFRRLGSRERSLLDTLLPNVALALLSHARNRRTSELLEHSRAQTQALQESEQRLQQQQDDLERANGSLRAESEKVSAQAEELQASEEELRVQAEELEATNEELREKQTLMQRQQDQLAQLHEQAEERADDLARANQYKSEFLANMSHELRTPLNSLLILSNSLADNDEGNLDNEQVEAARIIHESGTNLLTLINDILDLSKIEAGKMQLHPETVDIGAMANRMRRQFEHMAEARNIELVVQTHDDVPTTIVTDNNKLDQVLRNLIGNAIKFTDGGKVTVEIAVPAADTVFQRPELSSDDTLAFHVTDQGIGIPADRLEQIFQAFEQVDASTSRSYGGTGLGLSISRDFAELMGGEIQVTSQEGKGSRFSVYIPRRLNAAEAVPSAKTAQASVARQTGKPAAEKSRLTYESDTSPYVLIIDDDRVFTSVVASTARKRGFECSEAHDGQTGLDMIRQRPPDALVLDLGLPGMDGWTVLDRIKAEPHSRDIPVHIISASDDPGPAHRRGAVGYLQKPISGADLDVLFARAEAFSGRVTRRVLLIDDDSNAHATVAGLFPDSSARIEAVSSGADAITTLDNQSFDCVVLNLELPDTDGFDLLARIAERVDAPPVVVYSERELSSEETRRLRAHTDSIVIAGERADERLLDEITLFFHRIAGDRKRSAPTVTSGDTTAALDDYTVLLVDDDMRNTFALSRALRAHGLKVFMASDGYKALDQLAANPKVAAVLMDIMMPGMDGYETIRRIRAQPQFEHLPIIALTAKAMQGDRDKCIEAGANDYLAKPLDTAELVTLLRRLLIDREATSLSESR